MMDAKEFLMIWAKECRKSLCHDCKFKEGLCAWRPGSSAKNVEELEQRVNQAISIAEKLSHVNTYRNECPMKNKENGNCYPTGLYCYMVNDNICRALKNAYYDGVMDCACRITAEKK